MSQEEEPHFFYKTENLVSFASFSTFFMILRGFAMIFTASFVALLISFTQAATSDDEIPFVVASQPGADDGKPSSLLPEIGQPDVPPLLTFSQSPSNRGRSDIEIEDDQPKGGYFYPKPSKAFDLPAFKTLDADAPLQVSFAEETEEVDRQPRSPQRRRGGRRPYFQSPPPFVPGFIPPNQIRPLPALYGRRMGFF